MEPIRSSAQRLTGQSRQPPRQDRTISDVQAVARDALANRKKEWRKSASLVPSDVKALEPDGRSRSGSVPTRHSISHDTNLGPSVGESLTLDDVRKYVPNATQPEVLGGLFALSSKSVANLETRAKQVEIHEKAIKDHVEQRIQFFYLQLVACHRTGYEFDYPARTPVQLGKAYPFDVVTEAHPEGKRVAPRQGAHSSTISALTVSNEPQSTEYYLQGTDFFWASNATFCVPLFINCSTDAVIDGKKKAPDKLRSQALQILNEVAQGDKKPIDGLRRFVMDLYLQSEAYRKKWISEKAQTQDEKDKKLAGYRAGTMYMKCVDKWLRQFNANPDWFQMTLYKCCKADERQRATLFHIAEAKVQRHLKAMAELDKLIQLFIKGHVSDEMQQHPYFHDNFSDYVIKGLPSDDSLRLLLIRHYSYPGDLTTRTTYARYQEEDCPDKSKLGAVKLQDGQAETIPLWDAGLQSYFVSPQFSTKIASLYDTLLAHQLTMERHELAHRRKMLDAIVMIFKLGKHDFYGKEDKAVKQMLHNPDAPADVSLFDPLCSVLGLDRDFLCLHFYD